MVYCLGQIYFCLVFIESITGNLELTYTHLFQKAILPREAYKGSNMCPFYWLVELNIASMCLLPHLNTLPDFTLALICHAGILH